MFSPITKKQSSSKPFFPSFFIVSWLLLILLVHHPKAKPFLKLSAEASLTLFDETCLSYDAAQQAKSNIYKSFMWGIRGTPVCGWTGGLIYLFLPSPNSSFSGHWANSDAGLLAHCKRAWLLTAAYNIPLNLYRFSPSMFLISISASDSDLSKIGEGLQIRQLF